MQIYLRFFVELLEVVHERRVIMIAGSSDRAMRHDDDDDDGDGNRQSPLCW